MGYPLQYQRCSALSAFYAAKLFYRHNLTQDREEHRSAVADLVIVVTLADGVFIDVALQVLVQDYPMLCL